MKILHRSGNDIGPCIIPPYAGTSTNKRALSKSWKRGSTLFNKTICF